EHWMGAGEDELAAQHAVRAGEEAAMALAFDRAADYFGLALRLRGNDARDWVLHRRRAEALADAGRGSDAVASFVSAVAALRATTPDPARGAHMLGSAAEQYLYAGRWEDGLGRMREVMKHLGIAIPGGAAQAGRRANLQRLRFLMMRRPGQHQRLGAGDAKTR